ncbi:MAG: alpha-ketoglutarate-dependent dioxygenase AlkB [Parvibaculales bacterium]
MVSHNILGDGTAYYPEYCDSSAQTALLAALAAIIAEAPFFVPRMPRTNVPWSIRMTNCGALGWVSDKNGYRYQPLHPETGRAWPAMPPVLLDLWHDVTGCPAAPECCLINYYDKPVSKMGLHQDRDEEALDVPVVSLSLGDSAVFRMGGAQRRGKTRSMRLHSGDVLVFGGAARLNFHGLDRILAGSSALLAEQPAFADGGRLNLTLRRVAPV